MAEVKWIKITTDIFDDEKIKIIDSMPSRDEVLVIWFKLLALTGKVNENGMLFMNNKFAYTPEMLSAVFNRELNIVNLALNTFEKFGMISVEENEVICIQNWDKHQNIDGMQKLKEQNRDRKRLQRERQKQVLQIGTISNEIQESEMIEEFEEVEEVEEPANKKEHLEYFEKCWQSYPSKKGKGQVSETVKKKIFKIKNFEEVIERYIVHVESERKSGFKGLKYQNGSTFFNSGYVDFTDENFLAEVESLKAKKMPENTQFYDGLADETGF